MSGILHLSFMLVIIRDEKRNENKDNLDVYYMSNYNMKKVKPLLPKELQKLSVIGNDKSLNPLSLF